ncbi:hypothetical protein CCDC5079_3460 [Mycobacterium tuberculosis CCDC5079]|nr:hypothetical protein CCDC5079_3460 [Mycobacterium tuberculosis CCDC5079]
MLLVAAFGAFLAFLDSTIVNVAFPDIQRHFHSDISDLSWMLNAYNIVFAAFLVAAGRLADLMGRKRVFILGVALFTVASGLCAIAESVGELVAFRVLQGIGAAVLVPASLGLVVEAFPAERRAHGVNLWGAAGAIAAGLGPPIGGALIEADGWRWVFLVNLPLGVFAVLAARRALVENRAAGRRRVPDVRGAVLLAFALGLLTLGLIKGPDWGWASLPTSGSLLAAAVAMVGFVMSSRHHPAPMVEPTLLRIQSFVAGTGLTAVASAGFYAYLLTHVLFLNYVWGYTLLEAGMAVAPAALVAAVVAAVLGRVADRHGYRFIVGIGALIWAASLLWYLKVVGSQPDFLGEWLPGQILQGIGVGATFPLLGSAALARLAKGGSYATASAVTGTIRQVGAVIGVAVLVILVGTPAPGAAEEALRHGWALAAICFVAVGIGALSLGRIRPVPAAVEPPPGPPVAPLGARRPPRPAPVASPAAAVAPTPKTSREVNLLEALRFARPDTQQIELQAGSYLFHAGDVSDALYVVRSGRLQVLAGDGAKDEVVAELGRGQVVGELGVLLDAPRSASVRAVRDSSLMRVTKAEFAKIADAGVLGALAGVLAKRQHQTRVASQRTTPEVVVAVVGVDANAPVAMVATELCRALSTRLRAVAPGRVDCDGLERAEQTADRVVLHAAVGDARWREFCLRVADRVVLVASNPAVPVAPLPTRATGADLVLAGRPAGREHRRAWEQLITPRSMHVVRREFVADDLRVLATRIAGRSVGLVLSGGAARACAHLGVLEELEAAGGHRRPLCRHQHGRNHRGSGGQRFGCCRGGCANLRALRAQEPRRLHPAEQGADPRETHPVHATHDLRRPFGGGAAETFPLRQCRPIGPASRRAPPRPARRRRRLLDAAAFSVCATALRRHPARRRRCAGQRARHHAGGQGRPTDCGKRGLWRKSKPRVRRPSPRQTTGARPNRHPAAHHDNQQRDGIGKSVGPGRPGDQAQPDRRRTHGVPPDRPRP